MFARTVVWSSAMALMFSTAALAETAADGTQSQARSSQQGQSDYVREEIMPSTKEELLNKLNYANHMGVKLGELGRDNTQSDEVRTLANRLIEDHREAMQQVQQVAQAANISLKSPEEVERQMKEEKKQAKARAGDAGDPDKKSKKHEDKMAKLRELSGEAFDREFTLMVNKGHNKGLELLDHAEQQFTDSDVTTLVSQLRPTMRLHEQRAEQLAREFGATDTDFHDEREERETARL